MNDLEKLIEKHGGRKNLIPISFIKQQLFYAKHGCQPKFIWEKESEPGIISCWYLKSETKFAKAEWNKTRTRNQKEND